MTDVERLARFVVVRSWDDLSDTARCELKIRVLDALGCALAARAAAPVAHAQLPRLRR
jgi:2-methylcitrate dehydratase